MACVEYSTGLRYAMRVCEVLDKILEERHPHALVGVEPFLNGRETGVVLRCRQLGRRHPMHEPIAWIYEERAVGALEIVLGDTTHIYEVEDNMYYDWAYEHDRHTYGDDESVPNAEEVAEVIVAHFERVCEEYARPEWMR